MKSSDFGNAPPPVEPPQYDSAALQAISEHRAFLAAVDRRKPWVTYAIVVACGAAYLLQAWYSQSLLDVGRAPDMLARVGDDVGQLSLHGQPWRLWSSTFLHVAWWHIGGNMWALLALGPFLERAMGSPRMLVLYALSGLGGSLLSSFLHPLQPSVGASGAIWGVFTAAFALTLRPYPFVPRHIAANLKRGLVQALLINVAISLVPGVDAMAHLGGGIVGFVLVLSGALGAGAKPVWSGEREAVLSRGAWITLALALALAMLASLAIAAGLSFLVPR